MQRRPTSSLRYYSVCFPRKLTGLDFAFDSEIHLKLFLYVVQTSYFCTFYIFLYVVYLLSVAWRYSVALVLLVEKSILALVNCIDLLFEN